MKKIFFALPGNEELALSLVTILEAETGNAEIRNFPDGETYVRVLTEVKSRHVVLVCTLHHPNDKIIPLYLLSQTLRELGAISICLVAPYLAYMRQDKQFKFGEGVTSRYFSQLIPGIADSLVTIDPHLHRFNSLQDLYIVPALPLHAAPLLANWIKQHLQKPILIGPDEESMQWVNEVAKIAEVPSLVLHKTRYGDEKVEVSQPDLLHYKDHTPVLIDDIISTAHTMIETVNHLKKLTSNRPVCIGIHAVFVEGAYEELLNAGAANIVTCNTIPHLSNTIGIDQILAEAILSVG